MSKTGKRLIDSAKKTRAALQSGKTLKTYRAFDVANHLDNPKVIVAYLSEAFESGDPRLVKLALSTVARRHNVFADLGLPDADEHLLKANAVMVIAKTIKRLGLTQQPAAKR
jgi:hypothetical protein